MKLIVGLGNPGRKYQGSRHNVGFDVLAEVSAKFGTGNPRAKFQGETVDASIRGERALLLWPHTFMNLSGQSVLAARDFYKIEIADILVICDDFNLPVTKLRFRPKGSSGGQNGLHDIILRLGKDDFSRLRVGIGPVPENRNAADFVLGKFFKEDIGEIQLTVAKAAQAVADWSEQGIDYCMNCYNAKNN